MKKTTSRKSKPKATSTPLTPLQKDLVVFCRTLCLEVSKDIEERIEIALDRFISARQAELGRMMYRISAIGHDLPCLVPGGGM